MFKDDDAKKADDVEIIDIDGDSSPKTPDDSNWEIVDDRQTFTQDEYYEAQTRAHPNFIKLEKLPCSCLIWALFISIILFTIIF